MTTKKTTKKTTTKKATERVSNKAESTVESLRSKFTSRLEEARRLAKQSALAGLGAVDRSVEEVNLLRNSIDEQIAEVSQKGTDLFNELVERGNKVQADAEANIKENRAAFEKRVNERVESLKVRVAKLSEQLGVADGLENVADTLDSVSKKFGKKA